ncbi:MAG: GNAT family N-acetyltransferase [Micromonosporaceae bacterium]
MGIDIQTLDPYDDAAIDAILRVQRAARAVDIPDFPPPCRDSFVGLVRHEVSFQRLETRVARRHGEVVGYVQLALPLRDNTENSEIELGVHPEHRRRGVGRALYTHAVALLRDLGRKRTAGYTTEALPDGPERPRAGSAFAEAMGAHRALGEVRRRLDLSTADTADYPKLLAAAWERATGYRLVQWRDRVPDAYAADVGYLDSRMVTDAPMGDLAWEPENIDVSRIRESEGARAARQTRVYSTGLVHERSGRLVAATALGIERGNPWHAFQWFTIVDPDHRGHRLGTVAKLENLRYARTHEPDLRVIDTWNAAVNEHMISINETMGFRAVDATIAWQQEI